jgi:hypothetical protein
MCHFNVLITGEYDFDERNGQLPRVVSFILKLNNFLPNPYFGDFFKKNNNFWPKKSAETLERWLNFYEFVTRVSHNYCH